MSDNAGKAFMTVYVLVGTLLVSKASPKRPCEFVSKLFQWTNSCISWCFIPIPIVFCPSQLVRSGFCHPQWVASKKYGVVHLVS